MPLDHGLLEAAACMFFACFCNAKNVAIPIVVRLPVSVFERTAKRFCMIYVLLPKTRVTSTGVISFDTLQKVCVTVIEDFICDAFGPCYSMCFMASILSIRKITKMRDSQTTGGRWQKIQLFKAQKTRVDQ